MRGSPARPAEAVRTHGPRREVFMTGKRRIAAAMRHERVDRVPVMCQLAIGHYLLNSGIAPAELWFTSEGFARC